MGIETNSADVPMSSCEVPEDTTMLGVSEFKRRCLELVESVARSGREIVITKRGKPIAKVVGLQGRGRSSRGSMKGLVEIRGDIVECDWTQEWEAAM
jgi:prevent-host-death family protein